MQLKRDWESRGLHDAEKSNFCFPPRLEAQEMSESSRLQRREIRITLFSGKY